MVEDPRHQPASPQANLPAPSEQRPSPQGDASPVSVVGNAIQSLARAARSFTLYDPHNAAVKQLIADYKEKGAALMRLAPVALEILPFEIRYGAEAVYRETDRERSLSFRLFRDGVRRLRFEQGVQWSDFVTLLEVLAVRSVGVRQQEEDLITLLRKAHFKSVVVEAVDGYVPDEEQPEPAATLAPTDPTQSGFSPRPDWDMPLPHVDCVAKLRFTALAPEALDRLRSEEDPAAFCLEAVRAVSDLLALGDRLGDAPLQAGLDPFIEEVQDYLLVQRSIPGLAALADAVHKAFGPTHGLAALKSEQGFEKLMQAVSEDATEPPAQLDRLLGFVPGDLCARALDMLAAGARGARRGALLTFVKRCAAGHPELLISRARSASPELAIYLFGVLEAAAPDRSFDAAFELLDHPDAGFQLRLVDVIGKSAAGLRLVRGLQRLMGSADERVRVRAAAKLAERGGARALPLLTDYLCERASKGLSDAEAAALGRAIAMASPADAERLFAEWSSSGKGLRGLLSRLSNQSSEQRALLWAAVAGLELCPGNESDNLLEGVLARASGDLKTHCQEAIERRRGGCSRG